MTKPSNDRRLAAATALLAMLLAIISVIRIIVADPWGWLGVTGVFILLLATLYWYAFGRSHQRLLAALVGLGALVLLGHLLSTAPVSNLWNALSALVLLGIAWLAGRQALTAEPVPPPATVPSAQPAAQSGSASAAPPGGVRSKRMTLLVNPKSGGGKAEKFNIADQARALGIEVRVLKKGDDLQALAREAAKSGTEVLGMGGGDGSLALVASIAMEYGLPFICVPVGTRNHFAMDMNLDRNDPAAALAAFNSGEERVIDVATIGGHVVLNNASFGVYAATINEPGYREAKASAFRNVITSVLNGEREPFDLCFDTPLGRRQQAFIVFVGNNPYEFIGLEDFGGRARLDRGQLQITVIEPDDHDSLAKLAQGMIIGNPDFANGFQQWTTTDFEIDASTDMLDVGVDGEAMSFATPVKMRIQPKALRVLVPPGTPLERPNPAVFSPEGLQKLGELLR